MNYLKVPDSNIKLTDGSVVMLARFPGTKWVVHYGWYDYAGRRGMGWYFSSIPAQTVIPVTSQDLQLIVLVDPGKSEEPDLPPAPGPAPGPGPTPPGPTPPPPGPRPPRPPYDPDVHPDWPGPKPDSGLYPTPPDRHPSGDYRAYFSKNDQYLLDASWITLPSIRYRDALPTVCNIPNGKVVKINSVDGVTRYYSWNAANQRWDEKFYENDTEKVLVDYYTKEEIDETVGTINSSINSLEASNDTIVESLATEVANREAAIANEASTRELAITTETANRKAAITAESAARVEADVNITANVSALQDQVEVLSTKLDNEITARTD